MSRQNPFNPHRDPETYAMVYEGVNATQLSAIFQVDQAKINTALVHLRPCGKRNQADIYKIHEAAPHIVAPVVSPEDLERAIKEMHHTDLPMILRKEFWAAQRLKQDYEVKAGDLWPTTEVIEKVGELLKLVKMNVSLTSDTVERQAELTDKQRSIIISLMKSMLEDLQKSIGEHFTPAERKKQKIKERDNEL